MRRAGTMLLAVAMAMAGSLACGCGDGAGRDRAGPAPAATPAVPAFFVGAAADSQASFETATGVRPDVVEHYAQPGGTFSAAFAGTAVPMVQIMPFDVPLARIADGGEDGWLRSYAAAVTAYRRPVILGFAPEMNGSWYAWGYRHVTPAQYVAAWRHVVGAFRAAGALNVTWLWTVNVEAIGTGGANRVSAPAAWWPGTDWVTWTGIDGYYYSNSEDFADVFGSTVAAVRGLGRPMLISETAVAPAAGKAGKIPGLFAGARADRLLGLVWFDLPGNRDWELDDPAALAAFRAAVKGFG